MFSVDNFYDFMNSHYGLDADGRNVLYFFTPHGSKDWANLQPGYINNHETMLHMFSVKGSIIFHDQEPFDRYSLDTYKSYRVEQNKNSTWRCTQPLEETLLCNSYHHFGWQIFCHSEKISEDIKFVDESGSIGCYYFYHGLIARDWFRHWKHHGGIHIKKNLQNRFLLYARDCTGSRQYRERLIADLAPLKTMVNHDWTRSKKIGPESSATISVLDSQTCAIHIVAETVFDQNKIHLTEKVFKPVVMMQPFILFAGAKSLCYLRDYGFKTFDTIWDESYDLEHNHQTRYQKIMRLINDLSKLTKEQIDHLMLQAQPIIEHNHRWFFSEDFENRMISELHHNMHYSLRKQQEKTQSYPGGALIWQLEQFVKRQEKLPEILTDHCKMLLREIKTALPDRYQKIFHHHHWLINRLD